MFCDKCGTAITAGAQFCSSCGKAVGAAPIAASAPAAGPVSDGRVRRHIQILASLWLASGILRLVEVCWIFIAGQMLPFLAGWGMPGHNGNWPFNFLPFGLYSIGGVLAIFGIAHIVFGLGTVSARAVGTGAGPSAWDFGAAAAAIWDGAGDLHALGALA